MSTSTSKTPIQTSQAPAAVGPYSQAIRSGDLLFLSGQIPIDPATGELVQGDIQTMTRRVLDNLSAVLAAADASLDNVVKCTVFLADIADFAAMNEVYAQYFKEPFPARSAFQVAALPKGARVEIEAFARLDE